MLGFIYQWVDKKTGLKYIGRHEGSPDDSYIGSGTKFIIEYNKRPGDFEREILFSVTSSIDDLISKEEELLSKIPDEDLYHGSNKKYYNQVRNSAGYTSQDNPMKNIEVVQRMMSTREAKGTHKNPWEYTVAKYGYEEACKMKVEVKLGNTYGSGNKDKPKSEEHKKNISESIKKKPSRNGGRKPAMAFEDTLKIFDLYGYKNGAIHLGIGYEAFKSRVILARKKLTTIIV